MENKDYQEFVKLNIETAKILNLIPKEKHEKVIKLLIKKKDIIEKNGLFAGMKLDIINKKIEKFKRHSNK